MKRFNTFTLAVASLVSSISVMNGGVASAVPVITNGLVAHYEFNGNADDSSVVGNDGQESGSPNYVTGVVNSAIHFDGIDDSVIIPANSNLSFGTSDFSVAFWFRMSASEGGPEPGLSVDERCCDEWGYGLGASLEMFNSPPLGQVSFGVSGAGFGDATQTGSQIALILDDEWHTVVGTRSGSAVSVYLDGLLMREVTGVIYDVGESNPIYLGQRFTGGNHHHGTMDELSIYNRALSASEVSTLYSTIPEPNTAVLLGLGLAGMAARRRV